jgi:hypothetical protein
MMARGRSYKETLLQRLRDPEEAAAYNDSDPLALPLVQVPIEEG